MIFLWVLIGLAALGGIWLMAAYNGLVKRSNLVREAWSGMDVQLKRRGDLIPNLLESVKGYMAHESQVLANLTSLRAKAREAQTPGERAEVEHQVSGGLGGLFALAENYPDLKANQNFLELQAALSQVEEQIQMARRYYNGAVRDLNIAVESFPGNLVAGRFGFRQAEFFELADPSERAVPKVTFH